jgi:nitroreductase
MSNATIDLLKAHRSIRRFEDRPLEEATLQTLIECGQSASTSSNLQAYTVIQVADPNRKAELAALCADQVQIHQCGAFLVFCADLYRDRMANAMHEGERFDGDYAEALLIATVDVALVMQNVSVAAESLGLGICMIGAMRNHPKAVGALLGLPPFVYAVAGLCIGYLAQNPDCKPRLPAGAVFHREQYLDDETHHAFMNAYDQTMTEFYQSQGMHDRDPRWTRVMAGRTGRFHDREELDTYLSDQGFGLRVS